MGSDNGGAVMDRDLLTLEQVADLCQVNQKTIYRLALRGELKSTKVGRQWRFKRVWVDDYLERRASR